MGEVVVKVKLTNAGDETLVRRGLMKKDDIRTYDAEAIIDTGAVSTIIPIHVVEKLGWGFASIQLPNTPMAEKIRWA